MFLNKIDQVYSFMRFQNGYVNLMITTKLVMTITSQPQ